MEFIRTVESPIDDRLMLKRLIGHYNYQNTLVGELINLRALPERVQHLIIIITTY